MSDKKITGIEAAQLRALADALVDVDPEAVIGLDWTDTVLHVRIDHPDERRTWLAVTVDAEVIPAVGPAPRPG